MRTAAIIATAMLLHAGRAAVAQLDCGSLSIGPESLLSGQSVYAWSVFAADLDGDGDDDVLSASSKDHKIAWYENTGGGTIGAQQLVTSELMFATLVFAVDVDGDGDLDVLAGAASGGKLVWYENLDGGGSFGAARVITELMADLTSIFAADLDGDGDTDVLSSSYSAHRIAWSENEDGQGTFGELKIITPFADYATCATAADLDGDGDLDVLWSAAGDDEVAWHANDGRGDFGPEQLITAQAEVASPNWVFAADLDGDRDLDVLSVFYGENRVAWFENLDGTEAFGPLQTITTLASSVRCVHAADLDADGDADVLSASQGDDKLAWYENTDGLGSFGPQQVITALADGTRSVCTADLDGDGSLDVVAASPFDDTVAWYPNADGQGGFGPEQAITTTVIAAYDVAAADLDGDGDLDALSASAGDDKIAWYENLDGGGSFGPQRVVTTTADYARSVIPADLDGDGNTDLLSTSFGDKTLAWYRNLDGLGSFGGKQVITNNTPGYSAVVADLDGDGDLDAATSYANPTKIAWFQNLDGQGSFGPAKVVTVAAQSAGVGAAADIDGDGDVDLVVTLFTFPSGTLSWLENSGAGVFGPAHVLAQPVAGGPVVRTCDLDGDGDPDLLLGTNNDDGIAWFENTDGLGNFGPQQLISTAADGPQDLMPADVDGDGDLDVLSASWSDNKIAWYENTDGRGLFAGQQIITTSAQSATSVFAADLNGDGNDDVMYSATGNSKAAWRVIRPLTPELLSLGGALPGALGSPVLTGSSCLASGSLLTLTLSNALPESPTFLVMGLATLYAPVKGGVLVPFPHFVVPFVTGTHGLHTLVMPLPANVPPGLDVYFQHWIVDPAGPQGFAASNALTGVTQ